MALNPESVENVPERDPLEIAILSFSSMEPADVGSDIAGSELAKIKGFNAPLPETDLSVSEWQLVMSEYINKGLDPKEDSTRMLKYFDRQLKQALSKERKQSAVLQSTSSKGLSIPLHQVPFLGSVAGMLAGGLITGFTFLNENQMVDTQYPGYSNTELVKKSQDYHKNGSPLLIRLWNEELEEIKDKRATVLNKRLDQNPAHNIGKTSFWAGLAGTAGISSLTLGLNLFRRRSKQNP